MTSKSWIERDRASRLQSRYTFPQVLERGSGTRVFDTDGREYLDFVSGQVCAVSGHAHPKYADAIAKQAHTLVQRGSAFTDTCQIQLAEKVAEMCCGDLNKSYFACTGSESNEAALRMAKLITGRFEVAAVVRGYHGLTAGSFGITGLGGIFRDGYGPMQPGAVFLPAPYVYRCPFKGCDQDGESCAMTCMEHGLDTLRRTSSGRPAAVFIEVIQSAGGVIVMPQEWLREVRRLCDEWGALLVIDEAQTGFGRTGKMFAFEHYEGVMPDILTISKSLGGGAPVSGVVVRDGLAAELEAKGYYQSSSHTGDPLLSAAALANLTIIEEEGLVENARVIGDLLHNGLKQLRKEHEIVGDVRGLGLFLGFEIVESKETRKASLDLAVTVSAHCQENGLLIGHVPGAVSENIIRILPPLTTTAAEAERALEILDSALAAAS
ncbi:MAG: aspartate aminotransferase family protein [Jatrophihabitantaceae bacterium]